MVVNPFLASRFANSGPTPVILVSSFAMTRSSHMWQSGIPMHARKRQVREPQGIRSPVPFAAEPTSTIKIIVSVSGGISPAWSTTSRTAP